MTKCAILHKVIEEKGKRGRKIDKEHKKKIQEEYVEILKLIKGNRNRIDVASYSF